MGATTFMAVEVKRDKWQLVNKFGDSYFVGEIDIHALGYVDGWDFVKMLNEHARPGIPDDASFKISRLNDNPHYWLPFKEAHRLNDGEEYDWKKWARALIEEHSERLGFNPGDIDQDQIRCIWWWR